jgi:hypothetical protein
VSPRAGTRPSSSRPSNTTGQHLRRLPASPMRAAAQVG